MLGKKASRFHTELRRQFPESQTETQKIGVAPDGAPKDIRDKLRRLLPSNIFVQILAGPPELRTGIFGSDAQTHRSGDVGDLSGFSLAAIADQFLPFHDVDITNAQRLALFLDIVVLWLLRPPLFANLSFETSERPPVLARVLRGAGLILAGATVFLALWLSVVIATIPGEWQEKWQTKTVSVTVPTPRCRRCSTKETKLVSTHDCSRARLMNQTRRRTSVFSNTLVLPGFNLFEALKIDDPKKLGWKEHLIDLRGRHLEQAVLYGADLTKADLTGAHLHGASLGAAQLQDASFDQAHLEGAWLFGGQFKGASFVLAQLQGAAFGNAKLQGAWLTGAQLQGASLALAELQGASLYMAVLKATDLSDALLWRSDWRGLDRAKLGAVQFEANKHQTWQPVWRPEFFFLNPVAWGAEAYAGLRNSMKTIPEGPLRNEALKRIETLDCDNKVPVLQPEKRQTAT